MQSEIDGVLSPSDPEAGIRAPKELVGR
jgi:hypothetical protein